MNKIFTLKNLLWYILYVVIASIGVVVADNVSDHYDFLVNGILGLSVIFFTYRMVFNPVYIKPRSSALMFQFPGNIKYFAVFFFGSIYIFWAIEKVIYAFRCFIIPIISGGT